MERVSEKSVSFAVQAACGDIYQVGVGSIQAEPADRYGWKKDHLAIWLEFSPTVGSTLGTFIELPIRQYTHDDFFVAIMNEAQETINRILVKYEEDKEERRVAEEHKAELDSYAERVSSLLEPEEVPN